MQSQLPADVTAVSMAAIDAFLRNLLVTDGTVSRSLEAQTLRPVVVEPVEQSETLPPDAVAAHLALEEDEACMRRRVVMRVGAPGPSVWAESFLVPGRAPIEFLRALRSNQRGIGGTIEQLKLESWRELLWFGLASPPSWPEPTTTRRTLRRAYLVAIERNPSMLIVEDFALSEAEGLYSLEGCEDGGGVA
ncbi:MAG TPA: chorismate pyruvate-lyase family protein [Solirubrobacteraceae bacterium]|nr:chorismate pyruvate-lyase family protein [Solirubrobacteraceae bacterium]